MLVVPNGQTQSLDTECSPAYSMHMGLVLLVGTGTLYWCPLAEARKKTFMFPRADLYNP